MKTESGFTLVELTIVLVVVALLIGGMLVPLSAQRDIQNTNETQKQLSDVREALLGFSAAKGRLPCPAPPEATGVEAPDGGGVCTNPWDGFLPAITLGIQPTDAQGYAIESWGNRIRYAVSFASTSASTSAFTTTDGVKNKWGEAFTPDIVVCNAASAITDPNKPAAKCSSPNVLTSGAVALILSHGKNGAVTPTSANELANSPDAVNKDPIFVNASPGPNFDDSVVWLSPNILYNRMISAGRLP